MKIFILILSTFTFYITGLTQTEKQVIKIDSLKHVIATTEDDSLKIDAYWEWDGIIYLYDNDLDIELNQTIYELAK